MEQIEREDEITTTTDTNERLDIKASKVEIKEQLVKK